MKIVINKSINGVRDGYIYPELFRKNHEYEIDGDLLNVFLKIGACEEAKESKMIDQIYENKMINYQDDEIKRRGRQRK